MTSAIEQEHGAEHQPLRLVRKDIKAAAAQLEPEQARFFVDYYYALQDFRIQAGNQVGAATRHVPDALNEKCTRCGEPIKGGTKLCALAEPHDILSYTSSSMAELEETIQQALGSYATSQVPGRWAMSICGVGPVIAAGLLAHIDIEKAPSVGHIWRFAGLDPTVQWGKGQKRPWNAKLKTLCWKIGESFVKVQARESDIYGKVYVERKAQEQDRNIRGLFADQAAASLAAKNFGEDTDARAWYEGRISAENARLIYTADQATKAGMVKRLSGEPGSGVAMLPPARIHLRSSRYAVKLFLAHLHHVMYEDRFGTVPPLPYVISAEEHPTHTHFIAPPNWPMS